MKKSELLVQNQSLFAEVERRATEIEGLKIKIEELNEKAADIIKENDELKKALEELKAQNQELEQLNKQLHISALQGITLNNDAQTVEDDATEEAYEQQEVLEPEAVTEAESEPEPEVLPEQPIKQFEKTEKPAFTPAPEELSLYGAEVIGRVTRVTAGVLNKIEQIGGDAAASLNTLALGKNESIKFAVLSLAQSGREPNEIKAEMDRLANEAIIYLKSI